MRIGGGWDNIIIGHIIVELSARSRPRNIIPDGSLLELTRDGRRADTG